jgi:hypothetical protein
MVTDTTGNVGSTIQPLPTAGSCRCRRDGNGLVTFSGVSWNQTVAPGTTSNVLPFASRSDELVEHVRSSFRRIFMVALAAGGPGGNCADPAPPGRFELDDVDVVLDPACAP